MRRTSRVYLKYANKRKLDTLRDFLNNYTRATNYSISRLWSSHDTSPQLADKKFTDAIKLRFNTTSRLSQCIAKQAKETVRSQETLGYMQIPRNKSHVAHLDSRFTTLSPFKGEFDYCVKFGSGVPKVILPFYTTPHMRGFIDNGWTLSKSLRLGYDPKGVFIDIIFEKEKPETKKTGKLIGIDLGYRCLLYSSDRQKLGEGLKHKIEKSEKRRKSYHHYITTETYKEIKKLDLTNVNAIAIENLKNVKKNKRGKFPRHINRFLSFWHYAKAITRLQHLCEERGIPIYFKDPWKTSQRCPLCGNTDKKNRNRERFLCLKCGFADNADYVGSKNLEVLGLAGVYSLRLLENQSKDICPCN